jgi:serine/arginine repetitive matrix protein 2
MDTSSSTLLPIPRLRLTRLGSNPQLADGGMSKSPVAGPSRSSPRHDNSENDDEGDPRSLATPILTSTTLPTTSSSHYSDQRDALGDTPASRLRALLSRLPNDSSSKASEKAPAPPSDLDSDFDPPRFSPTTPSVVRESLKDLFSHALRDTPKKGRRRRNRTFF